MADFLDNLITRSAGHLSDISPRPLARYETPLGEEMTLPVAEDEVDDDVNVTHPSSTQPVPRTPRLPQPDLSTVTTLQTPTVDNSLASRQTAVEKINSPLQPSMGSVPTQSTQPPSSTNVAAKAVQEQSETLSEKPSIESLSPQPSKAIIDSPEISHPDLPLFVSNPLMPDNHLSESAADPESSIAPAKLPDDQLNPNHHLHTIVRPEAMTISASVSLPEPEAIPVEKISSSAAQPSPQITESSSTIEITIGRIEVRANQTIKPTSRSQSTAKPKSPVMSLADYLKARSDGGGG